MKEPSALTKLCGHGDIREIALITGYNVSYVRKVLDDQRKNSVIHDLATDIITMRDKIRQKYGWLKTSKKRGGFDSVRDVESVVMDMQFRSYRHLMESGLRRIETTQGLMHSESLIKAREELNDYDRHILKALKWMTGQRLLIEPTNEFFDIWAVVKDALVNILRSPIQIDVEDNGSTPSVHGDSFLFSGLIRAIAYHLTRITSPDGRLVIKSDYKGEMVNLFIYSHQCLLPKTSFEMLGKQESLNLTRTRYDDLEAIAVAGHFIMTLQNGSIQWNMHSHRTGVVKLSLPDGLKSSL